MDKCRASEHRCGGCVFQGVPYEQQLKEKWGTARGYLLRAGVPEDIMEGITGCEERLRYRNKMEFTFGNEFRDGPTTLGLHMRGSYMSITDASECQLVPKDFNTVLSATLSFCLERGYVHYHKKLHKGFLRCLILRQGFRTNELLINIVTTSEEEFDEEGYALMLEGLDLDAGICGILHTINDNPSDSVICEDLRILRGHPWYMEEILGLKFKVGAFSFFQTNVAAAERLYRDAVSLIDGLEGKTVYDLYCGTGTISQILALKAARVIGVEIVEEAVRSARANAELNGLTNCEFVCDDVGRAIGSLPARPDVIVVDPPRAGIAPAALNDILSFGVEQIVYVSCNPKSLAENLRQCMLSGYRPVMLRCYDNFPFTDHVETVVLMTRQ